MDVFHTSLPATMVIRPFLPAMTAIQARAAVPAKLKIRLIVFMAHTENTTRVSTEVFPTSLTMACPAQNHYPEYPHLGIGMVKWDIP